ncbi:DUF262 domain-containing protein [Chitinophaga silvisoli]|uniref:DUF262 domain-containing protein n=1 Tax=Chitinophaga silvisoli TaxID=2291814 RepID=A0A3E1P8K6_9BACT|nr:DUF262 domain-containing protein [Chitinophaga silvisoli]RFM36512.1 DUF262 domain-containing protein [Chitinophaga silvisoli]
MQTNSLLQLLKEYKIVIPPIQRDYAQGRNTGKIPQIRGRFLDAIVQVLTDASLRPLELDFIYGYTGQDQDQLFFYPLDGQQRLTTLFLIHWYVAQKEKISEQLLEKFSYATRKSSREFCQRLVSFKAKGGFDSIDEEIMNQSWFFASWQNDPTINAMLVMLKEIEKSFQTLPNRVWEQLAGDHPRLIFHILPMDDLGLPDDLYIKMNARGKELTDFEHFKSKFSEILDSKNAGVFNIAVDKEWSDLFWNIFKNNEKITDLAKDVDNGFLNFFWYLTHILTTQQEIQLDVKEDWITTINKVYKGREDNIQFLFACLNLFEDLQRKPGQVWTDYFYTEAADFHPSKVRLFYINAKINLFEKCAVNYMTDTFVLREQLILYTFIHIHLNQKTVPAEFYRTLRNHLEFASDSFVKISNLKVLYATMDKLVEGLIAEDDLSFSKRQIEEEKKKKELIAKYPDLKEIVYHLEDHTLLRGNIGIFDFDAELKIYGDLFNQIFIEKFDYFGISKALLTFGNYTQEYGQYMRRFGNTSIIVWREIFNESANRKGFEHTKKILKAYLDKFRYNPAITNEIILQEYLDQFVQDADRPKDIFYYYLKHPNFSTWNGSSTDGYYWWQDFKNKPYEAVMLFRTNYIGRHWSPFLLELSFRNENCKLENYDAPLVFSNGQVIFEIRNVNNGFRFKAADDLSAAYLQEIIKGNEQFTDDGIYKITQNADGLDLEDRIEKCNTFLNSLIH